MKLKSPWLIKPHQKVSLADFDSSAHDGLSEEAAKAALERHRKSLADLQELLYASQQRSVLIVLQGMDTAGKDGTISHIFTGVNPQGCDVASFKVPTPLEARHDFLWRCHQKAPAAGMITIFNRSHYEQVLSPRVHKIINAKTARENMDQINDFESMLAENGTLILKFFLHISREEQKARLQSRIDTPDKHWKLSEADLKERAFWPQYVTAYEDILSHTSRKHAPWFVIPADHKWFRNDAISRILVDALSSLKLAYPTPTLDVSKVKL
jgi:PPK2 family polyphosphate:nucleotide phosphotransferase